ncbi:MAG: hypothetical protein ACPL0B_02425 [Anaerolineales bacterium]
MAEAAESTKVTIAAVGGGTSASGIETVPGVAGENPAAFDLCYINADGNYYKTDSLCINIVPGLV